MDVGSVLLLRDTWSWHDIPRSQRTNMYQVWIVNVLVNQKTTLLNLTEKKNTSEKMLDTPPSVRVLLDTRHPFLDVLCARSIFFLHLRNDSPKFTSFNPAVRSFLLVARVRAKHVKRLLGIQCWVI